MSNCIKQVGMTRCECHNVEFIHVVRYARIAGIRDLPRLTAQLGFGKTCTACHSDLERLLAEDADAMSRPAASLVNPRFPSSSHKRMV